MSVERVNCRKCKYYYITWEAAMPYGCKVFGFKSRQLPSIVVHQSSGSSCKGYEEKKKQQL